MLATGCATTDADDATTEPDAVTAASVPVPAPSAAPTTAGLVSPATTGPDEPEPTLPATSAPPTTQAAGPAPTAVSAPEPCRRVTDFDEPGWVIVNDGVMGGQSAGEGSVVDGVLVFDGTIVTQGGGFSSVRGRIDGELDGAGELRFRLRTDGRAYELLADDALTGGQRVTHYRPIEVVGDGWQEVSVPLSDMEPRVFGRPIEAEPFRPDLATQIGVILADGVDGPFSIEIDWIDACP